jgi:hypothetical protein
MVAELGVVQAQAQVSITITIFIVVFKRMPCPVLEIAVFYFCYREHHGSSRGDKQGRKDDKALKLVTLVILHGL